MASGRRALGWSACALFLFVTARSVGGCSAGQEALDRGGDDASTADASDASAEAADEDDAEAARAASVSTQARIDRPASGRTPPEAPEGAKDGVQTRTTCVTALDCNDGSACTTDLCVAGSCTHTPLPAGSLCSDGLPCNGIETCSATGTCLPGVEPILNDGNPCTDDVCDLALGVLHPPKAVGTACPNATLCDGDETCDGAGACVPGTPLAIDDGQACTDDSCNPLTGVRHDPRPAGDTICSNANACDGLETCNGAGACQSGTPPVVDDGQVCTIDACSPSIGVTHTPIASCDPTPVQGDAPFETRASILGKLVSSSGGALTGATFTVYNDRASGAPRSDVAATTASDGSFRLRLTTFPATEAPRTPPQRMIVVIDSPGTIRAYREGYAHAGDVIDLGTVRLIGRDPAVTNVGPAGGTASDSQGRVQLVIPAGALNTTIPIQITPLTARDQFPARLPDDTVTMYGFELEPSGTTFSSPVTVRLDNYRQLPTTLTIPVGSYDPIENRWEHEGSATYVSGRYQTTITHFSTWDCNAGSPNDRPLGDGAGGGPNGGPPPGPPPPGPPPPCDPPGDDLPGAGSSWRRRGGSIVQSFRLPSVKSRSEDFAVTLHYDSGLAGSRSLGGVPTEKEVVARGTLRVATPPVRVRSSTVPRGPNGPVTTRPGECASPAGSNGLGTAAGSTLEGTFGLLGAEITQTRSVTSQNTEAEFGGWADIPLAPDGEIASTGLVTQTFSLSTAGVTAACIGNGGEFGVVDPMGTNVLVNGIETGPELRTQRKILLHHRFSSPFGAGWGVREVSRLFANGDVGFLVKGDGQEEEFRPRARVTPMADSFGEHAFARDPVTGEVFVVSDTNDIKRVNPATLARTTVLSGLALPAEYFHGLAIAYVGGVRHFVVATDTTLRDIAANGTSRTLATRTEFGHDAFRQSAVAAIGDVVFYTAGGADTAPILYRARLALASPALEALSATTGDTRFAPHASLSGVKFDGPRGLAAGPDGSLYLADPRRHAVYRISPSVAGVIDGASAVEPVMGNGSGRFITSVGDRFPALAMSINQPLRLSMAEDGILLVQTTYGMSLYDPVAREGELLFLEGSRGEIVPSLSGTASNIPSSPASFVALTSSALISRSYGHNVIRVDVDALSSQWEPTRTIARLGAPTNGFELTDTTRAMVWRFDSAGRLVEERRRTGETSYTVAYADAQSDRIDRIANAVGGQWIFAYAGGKLASVTDPAGAVTAATVDARGDLTAFVEPDGEHHGFVYDRHHMTSKASPRNDVTAYTYAADGTVATSAKPGGESFSFDAALASAPTYDAAGALQHTGGYTDPHGVRHDFRIRSAGDVDREEYTANGVAYVRTAVYPAFLQELNEPDASKRRNVIRRVSYQEINGVRGEAALDFDSLGRAWRQRTAVLAASGAPNLHLWTYASNGWLLEEQADASNYAQRYERDAAGRVLRVFDAYPGGSSPSGRETVWTWRADGQVATMKSHGVTKTFTYDDAGGTKNETGWTDTLGRSMSFLRDARGNVTQTSDGTATTYATYDANNRVIESRDALNNATTYAYANAGCGCSQANLVTSIHTPDLPAGVAWTMTYDAEGRLASVRDPDDFTETYEYELTGERKKVRDKLGRDTLWTHDPRGRILAMIDTLGRKHDSAYAEPLSGAWAGPTLMAGSANGTSSSTSLSGALRSGDYQVGKNAYLAEGYPAQISLYRDATFELGFSHKFDTSRRLTQRADRTAFAISSTTVPSSLPAGAFWDDRFSWSPNTALPVLGFRSSAKASGSEGLVANTNFEFDVTSNEGFGFWTGATYSRETFTRDAGGRVTTLSRQFDTDAGPITRTSTYAFRPDGRLSQIVNPDGTHGFTYDARGLLQTQVVSGEGTYTYGYDVMGRPSSLIYPDGHTRTQLYDDLGRLASRCYEYSGPTTRCYTAQYDAVGNPTRMVDPDGADVFEYDALDRLKKVTREVGGVAVAVEDYDYNALGALKVNAGVALVHQRPKLAGGGSADAAVPATMGAMPVTLDAGGRVTSLRGTTLTWNREGILREAQDPVPAVNEVYGVDADFRRVARTQGATTELYFYEGMDRVATLTGAGALREGYLFDGIDHPLRVNIPNAGNPVHYYYELDLAGNVRGLRASGGASLGDYRYSAFGQTLEDTTMITQTLRWKGRWFSPVGGGTYDVRARQWSPELGIFLSVDEFEFHDRSSTLWGWPRQNPIRWRDVSGRQPYDDDDPRHACFLDCADAGQEALSRCRSEGSGCGKKRDCDAEAREASRRCRETRKCAEQPTK